MLDDRKIQTCGKGWIVLKLYSDLVNGNDNCWKRDKHMYERLNAFKEMNMTKAEMKSFLKDVVNSGKKSIRHVYSNSTNQQIINKALLTLKVL